MALSPVLWLRPWLERSAASRAGWRWALRFTLAGVAVLVLLAGLLYLYATQSNCVRGEVDSAGPGRNTWRSTPFGCTRDPQDGRPAASSHSVVSLIWFDEAAEDRGQPSWFTKPDAPLRLDLSEVDGQPHALLTTAKSATVLPLDGSVCRTFNLHTWGEPPLISAGKPTLGGTLLLDCAAQGRQIRARLRFDHCAY